jgi:DNA-binding CsgD family transcriptional regulator
MGFTRSLFLVAYSRIEGICRSAADSRTMRLALVEELRRWVGFDSYVWLLTDPETSVGAAPLADIPPALLPQLPRLIGLKYLTELNRWTSLGASAQSLLNASGGDPNRSRFWQEGLRAHGISDVASMVFRDPFGCWGFLDLWRSTAFDVPALAHLSDIVDVVTASLRRCQANSFGPRATGPRRSGPVVLLLSPSLEVLGQTTATQDYLRQLLPPGESTGAPIPAAAYNVAAQLLAVEAGVDANAPSARVHLADGLWLSLRAARLSSPEQTIAVTIEETSPAERLAVFARAFGLTRRESELLGHLATGADTREVAGRMFVSEHTVQDHLKSVFAKTSARTRRVLLSRALGT